VYRANDPQRCGNAPAACGFVHDVLSSQKLGRGNGVFRPEQWVKVDNRFVDASLFNLIAYSSLAVLAALYVVDAVSNGSLRHEVQTLPLWFPIVVGLRENELAKWCGLPCLIFWFVIMVFIGSSCQVGAGIVSGHFSPVAIAMTIVIGIDSLSSVPRAFAGRQARDLPEHGRRDSCSVYSSRE